MIFYRWCFCAHLGFRVCRLFVHVYYDVFFPVVRVVFVVCNGLWVVYSGRRRRRRRRRTVCWNTRVRTPRLQEVVGAGSTRSRGGWSSRSSMSSISIANCSRSGRSSRSSGRSISVSCSV